MGALSYVILGAGAMGCLYGARLKKAGCRVTFIVSRDQQAHILNSQGLKALFEEKEEAFHIPTFLASDYHEIADVVMVFTKSNQTEAALASARHLIGPDTMLVSLQNGLGHDKRMLTYADKDHVVIGTSNYPSDRKGDGWIEARGSGISRMMTLSLREHETFRQMLVDFESAGLHPVADSHIYEAIWEKVAFNAALNSLTAILRVPQGYMGDTKEGRALAHTVVAEVCQVAKARNIHVDKDKVTGTVDHLLDHHYHHCPSMLQDVLSHRRTEIDFISGAVVEEAKKLGISIPVTETLTSLIRVIEQTYEHRLS